MRKLLLTVIAGLLFASDLNFVIGKALISNQNNPIINQAINMGYERQVWDFTKRVEDQDIDLAVKYMALYEYAVTDKPVLKYYLEMDKKASDELVNFIKHVNSTFKSKKQNVSLSLSNFSKGKIKLKLKKSQIKKITKKVIKENDYNGNFKTIMNRLTMYYKCEDNEFCMPFYKTRVRPDGRYYVADAEKMKPDLFFYEYFTPKIIGRRYLLNIIIYIITIDSDGEPSFEYQIIDDFNWKRNYRFIAAQSAQTIRDLISEKAKVDIR